MLGAWGRLVPGLPLTAVSGRFRPAPQIRAARLDDAPTLSALCVRSKAVWGYDAAFMALAHEALRISPAQIAAGDVWVATAADGSIAGVVTLGPSSQPDALELDKLFVEPRHIRGGFGRILLAQAVGEARRRGARRLTILADPFATAFYERNGARLVGEAPSDAIPDRLLPLYEISLD